MARKIFTLIFERPQSSRLWIGCSHEPYALWQALEAKTHVKWAPVGHLPGRQRIALREQFAEQYAGHGQFIDGPVIRSYLANVIKWGLPRPTRAKAKRKKRVRGAPRGGLVRISPARVREIPERFTVAELALVLGVGRPTVYAWIEQGLPFSLDPEGPGGLDAPGRPQDARVEGARGVRRQGQRGPVLEWLVATKRFRGRPDYRA